MCIASASGAEFVRVKVFAGAMLRSGGIIEGAYEGVRKARMYLGNHIEVYADVYDKMGIPLADIPLETMACQAAKLGADKLILTGKDKAETVDMIKKVKEKAPDIRLLAGGGANIKNINEILQFSDGAIVSSCLMSDTDKDCWDRGKIRAFMDKVEK